MSPTGIAKAATFALALYAIVCMAWPLTRCWCRRDGHKIRRSHRPCRGTGYRLRVGRYIANAAWSVVRAADLGGEPAKRTPRYAPKPPRTSRQK